jgi:hypothetical protein
VASLPTYHAVIDFAVGRVRTLVSHQSINSGTKESRAPSGRNGSMLTWGRTGKRHLKAERGLNAEAGLDEDGYELIPENSQLDMRAAVISHEPISNTPLGKAASHEIDAART